VVKHLEKVIVFNQDQRGEKRTHGVSIGLKDYRTGDPESALKKVEHHVGGKKRRRSCCQRGMFGKKNKGGQQDDDSRRVLFSKTKARVPGRGSNPNKLHGEKSAGLKRKESKTICVEIKEG